MTSSDVTDSASGSKSRPRLSDIFISYAREDMKFAQELARKLEGKGYAVWWDYRLLGGANYRAEIAARIGNARKVLVVWSPLSITSPFVLDEATRALQQNKLLPLSIDDAEPPLDERKQRLIDGAVLADARQVVGEVGVEGAADRPIGREKAAGAQAPRDCSGCDGHW